MARVVVYLRDQKTFEAKDAHVEWSYGVLRVYADCAPTVPLFVYAPIPGQYAKIQNLDGTVTVRVNE